MQYFLFTSPKIRDKTKSSATKVKKTSRLLVHNVDIIDISIIVSYWIVG